MGRKATDKLTRRKIGTALREERRAQDVEIETLADVLECSGAYLERVEAGDAGPSLGLLVDWCRALGEETHRLLRDAGV